METREERFKILCESALGAVGDRINREVDTSLSELGPGEALLFLQQLAHRIENAKIEIEKRLNIAVVLESLEYFGACSRWRGDIYFLLILGRDNLEMARHARQCQNCSEAYRKEYERQRGVLGKFKAEMTRQEDPSERVF
ncbi:MAG: hypothetical protein Q7S32_02615 [bacterium]|nr:hypothetical protein [bacterium]